MQTEAAAPQAAPPAGDVLAARLAGTARALGDAARRPADRPRDRGQLISPEFLTTDSFTTGSLDLSESR